MRLTVTEPGDPVYLAALRLLAARDYTRASLFRKLEQRGYAAEQIEAVINRLTAERFLDDRRYAERFIVTSRESGRYLGYRLRQELRRRGVPADLGDELLAACSDPADELDLARQLVARRYAGFDPATSDDRLRRRIAGFLLRRGFGVEVIRQVLDRRQAID